MQEKNNRKSVFFGNLAHLLAERRLKKAQVAEAIGVHPISFYRYFSSSRIPTRAVLEKLAAFFEVDVKDLLAKDLTAPQDSKTEAYAFLPEGILEGADADFAEFVMARTAELQREINRFAAEILERYNKCK